MPWYARLMLDQEDEEGVIYRVQLDDTKDPKPDFASRMTRWARLDVHGFWWHTRHDAAQALAKAWKACELTTEDVRYHWPDQEFDLEMFLEAYDEYASLDEGAQFEALLEEIAAGGSVFNDEDGEWELSGNEGARGCLPLPDWVVPAYPEPMGMMEEPAAICIHPGHTLGELVEYVRTQEEIAAADWRWHLYTTTVFLLPIRTTLPSSVAILTADNPVGDSEGGAEALRAELATASGTEPVELFGASPNLDHQERSFAAPLDRADAVALARRYGQNAIFIVEEGNIHLVPALAEGRESSVIGRWSDRVVYSGTWPPTPARGDVDPG